MADELRYWTGLFRRFRSFVLRRDVEVIGQCKLCGGCCRDILLQHKGRWLKKERHFDQLCSEQPFHTCFKITERDEMGYLIFTCSLLAEDNLCASHEARPSLCRNYPSKSLYYQGGMIRADCGYFFKTVTFRDMYLRRRQGRIPRFSDVLQQERERTGNK